MKRPVNQLAPADLPVPPGSREYLILLGLRYVAQRLAQADRKSREASARTPPRPELQSEGWF